MADIRPLRGWRYDISQVGDLSNVTAPPYDVIGPEQQDQLYKQHPCNVIRLILNRDEPGDSGSDERYRRASDFLRRWIQEGVVAQERDDALYAYDQEFDWEGIHFVRKGFLGRIRLERFGEGCVYPHEQTLSGPKADRLALTKACRMNLSPIFGLYPDADNSVHAPLQQAIAALTPLEARDHLGVIHRIWPVTDHGVINQVRERLRDKPIFIADGHHRYETGLNYREWLAEQGKISGENDPANFVLMMFVGMSDPGLVILPTHRLLSGLPDLTTADIRGALEGNFELEAVGRGPEAAQETWDLIEADGSQRVFGFAATRDQEWLLARVTDDSPMAELAPDQSVAWRGLGVSLLHKLALDHLLARRVASGNRQFKYVHQIAEVTDAQKNGTCQLACLVPPARIEHVEEIASGFEKMPPKSTYFYPKLQSGLVFNSLY